MSFYFAGYDSDLTARIMQWSKRVWGIPYSADFQCTHPWVDMMNNLYKKNLTRTTGVDSHFLADWWYRQSTAMPMGRDALCFRYQQETAAIDALRPNGITHIELVVTRDYPDEAGICMGVGLPAGATPLNGTFGLHPYGVGLSGDGWFDESPTTHILYGFIDLQTFKA